MAASSTRALQCASGAGRMLTRHVFSGISLSSSERDISTPASHAVTWMEFRFLNSLPISVHHKSENRSPGSVIPPPPPHPWCHFLSCPDSAHMLMKHSGFSWPCFNSPPRLQAVFKERWDLVTAELMFPGQWWVFDTQERWSAVVTGWVTSAATELRDPSCRGSMGVSQDAMCSHTHTHRTCFLCCQSIFRHVGVKYTMWPKVCGHFSPLGAEIVWLEKFWYYFVLGCLGRYLKGILTLILTLTCWN